MAKLVADVTTVINLMHGPDEVAIVLVRLARDDSVDPVHARDAAVRIAIKFSTEMRHHLFCADGPRGLANSSGAFIRHQRHVETDLEMR